MDFRSEVYNDTLNILDLSLRNVPLMEHLPFDIKTQYGM